MKNMIVVFFIVLSQITHASITKEEAISESRSIQAPLGLKNPDDYQISPTTVKEAQTSASSKKINFSQYSTGLVFSKTKKLQPVSTHICTLSKSEFKNNHSTTSSSNEVYQSGGWWYLKAQDTSGCRANCSKYRASAICFTR